MYTVALNEEGLINDPRQLGHLRLNIKGLKADVVPFYCGVIWLYG